MPNLLTIEVSMLADSHPIDVQNIDRDRYVSLPIDQYYRSDPTPMDPMDSMYPGRDYAISGCMDNTCGRLVCLYCRFTDKRHLQYLKWKIKN